MNATSLTLIGSYAPRQCGIATFTQDLRHALLSARSPSRVSIAAIDQESCELHPGEVRHCVRERERSDYDWLADELNDSDAQAVSLQHEYGIFGGPDGAWILDTLRKLRKPVITTCHTVLADPSAGQRLVLSEIARLSLRLVVMTERGRELLMQVFGVPAAKIRVIPHGIPDTDPASIDRDAARRDLGWTDRKVLLTNGLLSQNKGLHHVIEAMPQILAAHPEAIYVIAGATHPNLVRREGESYRESLLQRAQELGIADRIVFLNRFATRDELVRMIVSADLFVTPYLSEAQATSGVLSYASGLGKPVISTPYAHARELIDERRGVLVSFASAEGIAGAAIELFDNPARLEHMADTALKEGRETTWTNTGRRYLSVFDDAVAKEHVSIRVPQRHLSLEHLHRLTGSHGVFQHAQHAEPDLAHGYCTDDNARALMLARDLQRLNHPDADRLAALERLCFEFLCDAFNEDTRRFRNFRSDDGTWLEEHGSEDSHGRALWALGHLAQHADEPAHRYEAIYLFQKALSVVNEFTSPRAWAFTLLGIAGIRSTPISRHFAEDFQFMLGRRLMELHRNCSDARWRWFEDVLSYDNARLPQALLVTAAQTGDLAMRAVALDTLAWLMRYQCSPLGHFRAIGSDRVFHRNDSAPAQWDQQPLEAAASFAACLEAMRHGRRIDWLPLANAAHAWFDGANDLGLPMGDEFTGWCHDGLQQFGLNLNRGAESTLAYLQTRADAMHHQGATVQSDRTITQHEPEPAEAGT